MLKVLPIQTKEEQKELCARCGIPFQVDLLAYAATVDGKFVGMCQFTMRPEGGILYHLSPVQGEPTDSQALFVMGRAALNFIDLCGVHQAYFDGDASLTGEDLLHAIGFRPDPKGRLAMDLTGFFTEPCKHCQD